MKGATLNQTTIDCNEGWYAIYTALDEGWCATLHQITIDWLVCEFTSDQIATDCNEGWCATLQQITIDCNEGWCASLPH